MKMIGLNTYAREYRFLELSSMADRIRWDLKPENNA